MTAITDIFHNIGRMLTYDPSGPMLFSSGTFWALFLVFMPVYGMLRRRFWQMVVFVVAFSFFFYYKSSGIFVCLLGATSAVDWLLSKAIARPGASRRVRRLCVAASLLTSLGILAYFKYANFFLWNINAMVGSNFQPLDLVLPVGISFYTFQSVSYIIDVYKGRVAPTATWLEYAFFLSFFPALVAGPIVRADYFLPQIRENRHATRSEVYTGLWLIILGVVKKAIIADYIAQYNDLIFQTPGGYSGFETLMGIIGYTMQIYCDFSGYSDMAIGIALIMGFKLAKNFDFPYKARNLTDFWRRWHISLSTWLRDYIYIPLGGNRKGTARTYLNNFATMLIGGLWHGAAWKFVFWGAMHGAGLAVHKASKPVLGRIGDSWPVRAASWLVTMTFVALLWVFFRADSWADSWTVVSSVFRDFSAAYIPAFAAARSLWLILMLVIVVSHCLPTRFWESAQAWFVRSPWIVKLLIFIVVVQLVIELRTESVSPFIYFQF
ncbi:MAG: MBOAT family protein [Muribaculaceae bacterium]|nr:MBOAT family protein [Muribaculaceae bacterium]